MTSIPLSIGTPRKKRKNLLIPPDPLYADETLRQRLTAMVAPLWMWSSLLLFFLLLLPPFAMILPATFLFRPLRFPRTRARSHILLTLSRLLPHPLEVVPSRHLEPLRRRGNSAKCNCLWILATPDSPTWTYQYSRNTVLRACPAPTTKQLWTFKCIGPLSTAVRATLKRRINSF